MTVTIADVVRGTSGLLLLATAIGIAAIGRRRGANLALAAFLASFGGLVALVNFTREAPPLALIDAGRYIAAAAALFVAFATPSRVETRERAAFLAVLAFPLVWLSLDDPSDVSLGVSLGSLVTMTLALGIRAVVTAPGEERKRRQFAALALLPALHVAGNLAVAGQVLDARQFVVFVAFGAASAILWLAAGRHGSRACVTTGIAVLAACVAIVWQERTGQGDVGTVGIFRTLAWAVLVLAVVREDLLGVPLPRLAVRRGALGAGALAALFITAQVAQNFLAAQYGLLMGGVVAGAFLFAAQPLQRAFEGRAPAGAPAAVRGRPGDEDMYRATLRRYLADGALSRAEERHLAHLAARLGIDAGRAVELRHEAEDEAARDAAEVARG